MIKKNIIKTPINYTGNKSRLIETLFNIMPRDKEIFVDLFCGGGSIGLNYNAKKIYMIDSNEKIINLLEFLSKQKFDIFYNKIKKIIKLYGLTLSYENTYKFYKNKINYNTHNKNNGLKELNKKGFYSLREDYNKLKSKTTNKANLMFYVLMIYAFNNDVRFNSSGQFNMPVGKTDMNNSNILKLKSFINSTQKSKIIFICSDFRSEKVIKILNSADLIYIDPPYFGTNAVYNTIPAWTNQDECDLLSLTKTLVNNGKKIFISNMIKKNEKNERYFYKFIKKEKYKIYNINYHYKASSYNKKNRYQIEQEVLIEAYKWN